MANENITPEAAPQPTEARLSVWVAVTILVGIASGLAGMFLALLLHYVQHVAYGYSLTAIISNISFLEGVQAASYPRRVIVLTLCGVVAGVGWWCIYRYGKPLVSIAEVIKAEKPRMPVLTTLSHALLQIITVGLGSPLGREVAPREVATLFACWLGQQTGLSTRQAQIMAACAAGAGLAAVYNVPLGGAFFTIELLLATFNWNIVIPALATSAIAVVVSWIGLGNAPTYLIPSFSISYSLVTWSVVAGPLLGFYAYWFIHFATTGRRVAKRNGQQIVLCIINFMLIGLLAMYFPELLGNGKSPARMEFNNTVSLGLTGILLVLRSVIVWSSMRAGAHGGLLTPSLANGALLGVLLGGVWSFFWTGVPYGAFAIVGAAAFLAAAQKMPLTAMILMLEFTRVNLDFIIPILFATSGALAMHAWCTERYGYK